MSSINASYICLGLFVSLKTLWSWLLWFYYYPIILFVSFYQNKSLLLDMMMEHNHDSMKCKNGPLHEWIYSQIFLAQTTYFLEIKRRVLLGAPSTHAEMIKMFFILILQILYLSVRTAFFLLCLRPLLHLPLIRLFLFRCSYHHSSSSSWLWFFFFLHFPCICSFLLSFFLHFSCHYSSSSSSTKKWHFSKKISYGSSNRMVHTEDC